MLCLLIYAFVLIDTRVDTMVLHLGEPLAYGTFIGKATLVTYLSLIDAIGFTALAVDS